MRTVNKDRLRAARNEDDVVGLVRDYFGDWLPEELGQLPEECRPGKIRDAEDLNALAFNLARACVSFEVEPSNLILVEEMDAFVGQAVRRMAEIQRRIPAEPVRH